VQLVTDLHTKICLCVQFVAVIYSKDPPAPKNDFRASTSLLINTSHNESTTVDKDMDCSDII